MLLVLDESCVDENPDDEANQENDRTPQAGASDATLSAEMKGRIVLKSYYKFNTLCFIIITSLIFNVYKCL
jgi:hypothetical protein